jgi:hypothetical protein
MLMMENLLDFANKSYVAKFQNGIVEKSQPFRGELIFPVEN